MSYGCSTCKVFWAPYMSYGCSTCKVFWAPYMCHDSACPQCGGGLARSQEPMTRGAVAMYAQARNRAAATQADRQGTGATRAQSDVKHAAFEDYYVEHTRLAAEQPEALEQQGRLPTIDPEDRAS